MSNRPSRRLRKGITVRPRPGPRHPLIRLSTDLSGPSEENVSPPQATEDYFGMGKQVWAKIRSGVLNDKVPGQKRSKRYTSTFFQKKRLNPFNVIDLPLSSLLFI
ncbi:hypothetical protein M231_00392 [Tremella mesenterica]|uniref:Uncharacterized protein n=1 Tax=Tremella mesenterica TaxID=5217 RepID=A0A4Q1BWE0_TREME|nr:hypothetical protein M231_00392 [Tremella mesenterica]